LPPSKPAELFCGVAEQSVTNVNVNSKRMSVRFILKELLLGGFKRPLKHPALTISALLNIDGKMLKNAGFLKPSFCDPSKAARPFVTEWREVPD
jgi:hypothetical protein